MPIARRVCVDDDFCICYFNAQKEFSLLQRYKAGDTKDFIVLKNRAPLFNKGTCRPWMLNAFNVHFALITLTFIH